METRVTYHYSRAGNVIVLDIIDYICGHSCGFQQFVFKSLEG